MSDCRQKHLAFLSTVLELGFAKVARPVVSELTLCEALVSFFLVPPLFFFNWNHLLTESPCSYWCPWHKLMVNL